MASDIYSVYLVTSDSKGDRLLFRYPYVHQNGDASNKIDKKKKNPYSIMVRSKHFMNQAL